MIKMHLSDLWKKKQKIPFNFKPKREKGDQKAEKIKMLRLNVIANDYLQFLTYIETTKTTVLGADKNYFTFTDKLLGDRKRYAENVLAGKYDWAL